MYKSISLLGLLGLMFSTQCSHVLVDLKFARHCSTDWPKTLFLDPKGLEGAVSINDKICIYCKVIEHGDNTNTISLELIVSKNGHTICAPVIKTMWEQESIFKTEIESYAGGIVYDEFELKVTPSHQDY